jgi:hypothetical protein
MMSLADVASQVVAPAVRAVFRDDEVSSLALEATGNDVVLTLIARDETFKYPVIQGEVPSWTPEEWRENLRSLLADFVAESRFGWGENRDAR